MLENFTNWVFDSILRRKTLNLKTATEEQILNYALDLAQEWGPNWMTPVNDRMKKIYPEMEQERIDSYSAIAGKVMNHGYDMVSKLLKDRGGKLAKEDFGRSIRLVYPWVDNGNISSLLSSGTYYHFK